ncbi:hypothetical protein GW17_00042950 [Ensete ventricosum]|nr:hypothetical protein GW17_00042950 [Ensete ventricosum]
MRESRKKEVRVREVQLSLVGDPVWNTATATSDSSDDGELQRTTAKRKPGVGNVIQATVTAAKTAAARRRRQRQRHQIRQRRDANPSDSDGDEDSSSDTKYDSG